MRALTAEALAVLAVATALTAVIAAPVLQSPSTRLFGVDLVGRQHDPFTVMQQFANPGSVNAYTQPVTDAAGVAMARIAGPVAAYNWLVLASFPLSALAAYLLGRYLALSRIAAAVAALAYAFAPFHLAHAAYHPHVAQTQWLPLYLLALWRCADAAGWVRVIALIAAATAVTLSNFYGGLVAAVLTGPALAAHWLAAQRSPGRSATGMLATVLTLSAISAAGVGYVLWAAPGVMATREALVFPRADLFLYSAKWWSYLLPPAAHPALGTWVIRFWQEAGVGDGLLEQQVSLGWGIVALAGVAAVYCFRVRGAFAAVPGLLLLIAVAALCSLSPERTVAGITFVRPSALLYRIVPMFRSYARFGGAVQLMAALLAGFGVEALLRSRTLRSRWLCLSLVTLAAFEYTASPWTTWRDVLPTAAHRWVMQQPQSVRALDCTPLDAESASVLWLTQSRIRLLDGASSDCSEPNLAGKLAAQRYTHLLVRTGNRTGRAFFDRPVPQGLQAAGHFRNAQLFQVVTAPAPIYTAGMSGFWPREQDGQRTWRWMQRTPGWVVVNSTAELTSASLAVELWAAGHPRRVAIEVDGHVVMSLLVALERRVYQVGAFTLAPGVHRLTFVIDTPDATAAGDPRPLSCAVGDWSWSP